MDGREVQVIVRANETAIVSLPLEVVAGVYVEPAVFQEMLVPERDAELWNRQDERLGSALRWRPRQE